MKDVFKTRTYACMLLESQRHLKKILIHKKLSVIFTMKDMENKDMPN